jgi:hypothetical protein
MAELTRRHFLQAAATMAGGIALSRTLPAAAAEGPSPVPIPSTLNGTEGILKKVVGQYARLDDDPWVLMHGIRAMGRDFTVKGEKAVDFLCSRFLKQKTVAGKSYLHMLPEHDGGHANAFLKTILEAGIPPSHSFRLDGRRYTVGDLVSGAKALFVFDPKTKNRDDNAWTLIAFSLQISPSRDVWTNAEGQRIAFSDLVRSGFDAMDNATRQLRSAKERGVIPDSKDLIQDFTCGGTHLLYGLASAVGNGHRGSDFPKRLKEHLDLHVWRLEADGRLIDRFFTQIPPPPGNQQDWEKTYALYRNDATIKFYGHSFEILSYARRRRLFSPTPAQARAIEKAGATLTEAVKGIKEIDLFEIRTINRRLFHLLVGDSCHAYHGIHMVPGVNQV